ncbi:MAG: hypothetical protein IJT27_03470 [Clostridia bacterium]|nr:hypothetical protein [Clostridia bacterium]
METQFYLTFALGFFGVFSGSALYDFLCRKTGGLTVFQRFLFGTGFSYMLFILLQTVLFFVDYYVPGADYQCAGIVLRPTLLFYRIFGQGKGGARQLPMHVTDLRILFLLLGALVGGIVLLSVFEHKNKKAGGTNGLFYGYTFQRKRLGAYIADEWRALRKELYVLEYFSWWMLRGLMVWAMIRRYRRDGYIFEIVLLGVNLAATFSIPLIRFLCFKKLFLGRLPFRVQTFCNILIFFGSFLIHGLGAVFQNYDKYLHVISGAVVVVIGFVLIRATRRGRSLPAGATALASGAFSCVVITLWELFEFFADYYIPGSDNQNLQYEPPADVLFFRVFGTGAQNPTLAGVLDTDLDIFFALFSCSIFTVGLYVFLRLASRCEMRRLSARREKEGSPYRDAVTIEK